MDRRIHGHGALQGEDIPHSVTHRISGRQCQQHSEQLRYHGIFTDFIISRSNGVFFALLCGKDRPYDQGYESDGQAYDGIEKDKPICVHFSAGQPHGAFGNLVRLGNHTDKPVAAEGHHAENGVLDPVSLCSFHAGTILFQDGGQERTNQHQNSHGLPESHFFLQEQNPIEERQNHPAQQAEGCHGGHLAVPHGEEGAGSGSQAGYGIQNGENQRGKGQIKGGFAGSQQIQFHENVDVELIPYGDPIAAFGVLLEALRENELHREEQAGNHQIQKIHLFTTLS